MPSRAMEPHDRLRPQELAQHREFLCRLARSLLHDAAGAEDVVHGAFALALERPPRDAEGLAVWLRTVVRRLALNVRREEGRRRAREESAARPEARQATDEAAASLEIQELVLGGVRALAEPYRTTLWLRYYEDLGRKEIARRQGVPERTVQTRLARGLERLRAELDRRADGDRSRWLGGVLLLARSRTVVPLTAGLAGGMLMKKVGIACALVLVLGVAWRSLHRAAAPAEAGGAPLVTAAVPDPTTMAVPPDSTDRIAVDAEPAEAVLPRGALRIRVRWDDGTPAADVGLFVFPEDDPLGERSVVPARTDGAGLALVESIHAGAVRIEADRGEEVEVRLAAGEEREVVLDLSPATDVEGIVTDDQGVPIAGAEILLLSDERDWLTARVVGCSDANGRYSVRSVDEDFSVSARAARHVPAFLQPLREPWGESWSDDKVSRIDGRRRVRANFVLDWAGFALRGVVRDPEQLPIAGALVAVGRNRDQGYSLQGEATRRRLGMPVVRTDENGRFEASGVEHAGMPVAVMAEGFPVQIADFPGWVRSITYGEIALDAPASIAGIVRDPDGAPLAGALVEVTAIRERLAQEVPFPLPRARSDERGRYRLELVASGTVPVRAGPPAGRALGQGFATVITAPGEQASLDFRLHADDGIRGRARDARGAPMAGTDVTCSSGEGSRRRTTTDAEGRFEFQSCSVPPYRLELIEPGGYRALAELALVVPGPGEVVLVAPETGTVTGVFVDEGKRVPAPPEAPEDPPPGPRIGPRGGPPGKPSMYLSSPDGLWGNVRWSGEAFTFENVPVGRYRLFLRAGEDVRDPSWTHRSDWFELRGGETIDLGVIRTPATGEDPAGSLVLEVAPPGLAGLSTVLRSTDHDVVAFIREEEEEGALRAGQLAPGRYFVSVRADGMGDACVPVEILARQEAHVRVQLEPGTARTLSFPTADPAATWSELKVSVKESDGQPIAVARLPVAFDDSRAVLVHVPVGRFTVEADTDTGLAARGTFTVSSLSEQDSPLVFELR